VGAGGSSLQVWAGDGALRATVHCGRGDARACRRWRSQLEQGDGHLRPFLSLCSKSGELSIGPCRREGGGRERAASDFSRRPRALGAGGAAARPAVIAAGPGDKQHAAMPAHMLVCQARPCAARWAGSRPRHSTAGRPARCTGLARHACHRNGHYAQPGPLIRRGEGGGARRCPLLGRLARAQGVLRHNSPLWMLKSMQGLVLPQDGLCAPARELGFDFFGDPWHKGPRACMKRRRAPVPFAWRWAGSCVATAGRPRSHRRTQPAAALSMSCTAREAAQQGAATARCGGQGAIILQAYILLYVQGVSGSQAMRWAAHTGERSLAAPSPRSPGGGKRSTKDASAHVRVGWQMLYTTECHRAKAQPRKVE
jgi:hypothetical protein